MNIEKLRHTEMVRAAALKHRGNISKVVQDTRLPIEFVASVIKKMQRHDKHQDGGAAILVAESITKLITEGHHQRVHYLEEMLESLNRREQCFISECCRCSYSKGDDGLSYCNNCGNKCIVKKIENVEIYRLKEEIIEKLRAEGQFMVEFADKMGYTFKDPEALIKVYKHVLVLNNNGNNSKKKQNRDKEEVIDVSDSTVNDLGKLKGPAAESLIKKLENFLKDDDSKKENIA